MLQRSKFVNTKSQQKGQKPLLQLPILAKDLPSFKASMELIDRDSPEPKSQAQEEPETNESPQSNDCAVKEEAPLAFKEPAAPRVQHASVNLEEMQRLEELKKQDEDWVAFFMGNASNEVVRGPEYHVDSGAFLTDKNAADKEGEHIITTPAHPELKEEDLPQSADHDAVPPCDVSKFLSWADELKQTLEAEKADAAESAGGGLDSIFSEMIEEQKVFAQKVI